MEGLAMARSSTFHLLAGSLLLFPALAACGREDSGASSPSAAEAAAPSVVAVSGVYDVSGVTVQAASGRQRPIAGSLELRVDDNQYEVAFRLKTQDPIVRGEGTVEVTGQGRGFIVGGVFTGTTEEQIVGSPADLRVVSTSQARLDADGVLHVELQNWPGEGQAYSPSVTVLQGRRVGGLDPD